MPVAELDSLGVLLRRRFSMVMPIALPTLYPHTKHAATGMLLIDSPIPVSITSACIIDHKAACFGRSFSVASTQYTDVISYIAPHTRVRTQTPNNRMEHNAAGAVSSDVTSRFTVVGSSRRLAHAERYGALSSSCSFCALAFNSAFFTRLVSAQYWRITSSYCCCFR